MPRSSASCRAIRTTALGSPYPSDMLITLAWCLIAYVMAWASAACTRLSDSCS